MILDSIDKQLTKALKAGDKETALTLRSLKASLHNARISKRGELTDEDIVKVLRQELKKRIEAETAFREAGRDQGAQNEAREKELICTFLPKPLTAEELNRVIDEVLLKTRDKSNFGQLMKAVTAKTGSRAEGGKIAAMLKSKISP